MDPFRECVRTAIAATPVPGLLATNDAVVLERLARGGGATNWYYCHQEGLNSIAERLLPGSVVSFYFDNRISRIRDSASLRSRAEEVIAAKGECVVAALATDGCVLNVDFVSGQHDLQEFLSQYLASSLFFAGEFPARDNDGCHAVTITIPDLDGQVREHPH